MGEAKRRKELGLPPREKPVELKLPVLDKENIQKKVRSFLYKNPIVPFIFYGLVLGALSWGVYNLVKGYQLIKPCPPSIFTLKEIKLLRLHNGFMKNFLV